MAQLFLAKFFLFVNRIYVILFLKTSSLY